MQFISSRHEPFPWSFTRCVTRLKLSHQISAAALLVMHSLAIACSHSFSTRSERNISNVVIPHIIYTRQAIHTHITSVAFMCCYVWLYPSAVTTSAPVLTTGQLFDLQYLKACENNRVKKNVTCISTFLPNVLVQFFICAVPLWSSIHC